MLLLRARLMITSMNEVLLVRSSEVLLVVLAFS